MSTVKICDICEKGIRETHVSSTARNCFVLAGPSGEFRIVFDCDVHMHCAAKAIRTSEYFWDSCYYPIRTTGGLLPDVFLIDNIINERGRE